MGSALTMYKTIYKWSGRRQAPVQVLASPHHSALGRQCLIRPTTEHTVDAGFEMTVLEELLAMLDRVGVGFRSQPRL